MKANKGISEANWRKSSYSNGDGDCVESAEVEFGALVRDTKARQCGHLTVSAPSWSSLVAALKG
ncbi:DUF397 domain-containing protein [Embleya sp. AB8]|uniref:DUF397 domain-containing protein n=1 Tax=Embleya sp. AB8 TaxID=3156304 RepID=UPI003C7210E3